MSHDPDKHITIDFVKPKKGGEDLMGCYFVYNPSDDTYSFFEQSSENPLATGLQKGQHFDFTLKSDKDLEWSLHISKKSTHTMVEGKWKDWEKQSDKYLPSDEWEPEQSYQATAGGGAGADDETNAATAAA